ncbi:MAG TPA: type II secretion system F family protein [Herbaspirillum sp.]|nr:type II secretion system F family protein [Herbaspirillum sp.]
MSIIYYLLIFISVALGAMGILTFVAASATQRRVQEMLQPAAKSDWVKTVAKVVGPFAKLSAPDVKWETSPLRIKFITAGFRNESAPLIFYGIKTLLPVLFAGIGYLVLQISGANLERNTLLFVVLVVATIGCFLPNFILRRMIVGRKREIFESFPDAADLMLVCVEAGLGLDAALTRVAEEMQIKSVVLAQEIHLTNLEIRAGNTREHALRNLGMRTGVEEIGAFASMLSQSDKFGTSVGESLRVFSDDLRHKRQMRAEELAAKLSTKMLFPLVICIFPAISMVVLGPAIIRIWNVILPMLVGHPAL